MTPSSLKPRWLVTAALALVALAGCSYAVSPGSGTEPCPDGSFGEGAGACAPWSVCAPGQFQSAPGTSTADAVCEPCPAGTFSTEANAAACRKWTACAPGEQRTAQGTAVADARCEACPVGSFSNEPDSASCPRWRDCPRGEYVAAAATATADRVCAPCPAGAFSAAPNAGNCSPWTECAPGEYLTQAGTDTDDQGCTACPSGTFSDAKNAGACRAWKDCAPGEYIAQPGSASADRVCAACPAGTFSTGKNAAACAPWTACLPGEHVDTAGTATSNQYCAACDLRTFTSTANAVDSQPWRDCRAGTYVANTPSKTADRDCQPCAAGTTSNVLNSPFCRSLCENGGVPLLTGGPTYVFDLAGDFASGQTGAPRLGPWLYAWGNPTTGSWTLTGSYYSDPSGIEGVVFQGSNGGGAGVFKNISGTTLHPSNTTTVGPGGIWLHPGQYGQNAVAIWSAPTATATWTVSAVFTGASGYNGSPLTTTDVSMTSKQGTLFSNYLNLGYRSPTGAFNLTRASTSLTLAYGDQVAAAVGYGNADWGFDATLVDMQVSTGFTCACPLGTWGARCERTTVSLDANGFTTCALESDATVACWPAATPGALFPYGVYGQIATGNSDRSCGIVADGSMLCFGKTIWSSTTQAFKGKYVQVDMNYAGATCALKTDGTVECYGVNFPPTGKFTSISMGDTAGCGVRPDNSLTCWDVSGGIGGTPSGTDFVAVEVSSHACAIRKNGTVVCWGGSLALQNQAIPPDIFTKITLGNSHACGLKPGGGILCWGDSSQGKTSAPAGVFVAIAAGWNHTCAVRSSGEVVCWGDGSAGQLSTSPPTACGVCAAPQTCGGGGTSGVCGCTPTSCTAQKKNCGTIPDGCGGTLTCGSCTAPSTCGGGGAANVCGCTTVTCADFGYECGTISDGCGQPLSCGQCNASLGQVCKNHFCVTIVPD